LNFAAACNAQQAGDLKAAERAYRAILQTDPKHTAAALNLARMLMEQGQSTQAMSLYKLVLSHEADHIGALNDLGNAALSVGFITDALVNYRRCLQVAPVPVAYRVASNYLTALQYHPQFSDEQLLQAAVEIGLQMPAQIPLPRTETKRSSLRIGFVSADFCDHPVGLFLLPLLENLDRAEVEVTLYSCGSRNDGTVIRLKALAKWKDISRHDYTTQRTLICEDGLDVLIDLSGHTAGNRLPMFAMRAAPMQVSWLGYFATTGVPSMDYVLMDPHHVPRSDQAQFSELVAYMPNCRFCYQPPDFAPDVVSPPCLERGHITFGSFNNVSKLNDGVIDTWAAILKRVPGSRLVLKWNSLADTQLQCRLADRFSLAGVERERIEFRGKSHHVDLLLEYGDIDIALDPFPFTGGLTSCETMWMGVPLVTMLGTRAVSRQTYSLLVNVGRKDWVAAWVATSTEDYIAKAVSLANDRANLVAVRGSLRQAMKDSPLMDAVQFSRDFMQTVRYHLTLKLDGPLS
jgi:predicted O-linked N-acetylglucosamine transferase (SPINDLY family)